MKPDVQKPLRVLAYTDAVTRGGAEESLGNLLAELNPKIAVTVAGCDPEIVGWLASRRPRSQPMVLPRVAGKWHARAIAAHVRAFRRRRPQVVHANLGTPWQGQYGLLAGLATPGAVVVAVEHCPLSSHDAVQRRLKRWMAKRLPAHVAVGHTLARSVEEIAGLPRDSITTIHNGVPDRAPPPLPRPAPSPLVGTIGRLVPEKAHDILIEALARLPGTNAVIVGEGPDQAALERRAADLGVADRLVFTGWVPDSRAYLPWFDVFALPSRVEGFPLTPIEAMLACRAVVASNVGGVSESVVHGETGVLVPSGDAGALADALSSLLAEPARAFAMGCRGRTRALELFSVGAMARRFESLYDELRTS